MPDCFEHTTTQKPWRAQQAHQTASTRKPWRAQQAHQTASTRSSDRAVSLLRHGNTGIVCQTALSTRQHRSPGVRIKHTRLPQHGSPGVRIKHTRLLQPGVLTGLSVCSFDNNYTPGYTQTPCLLRTHWGVSGWDFFLKCGSGFYFFFKKKDGKALRSPRTEGRRAKCCGEHGGALVVKARERG